MAIENETREKDRGKPRAEIKVTDRRHFTSNGEPREEFPEEAVEEPPRRATANATAPDGQPSAGFERRSLSEPEGVDFTMLINAMAQPALWFLGEVADPATGQRTLNLEQARLQIDMLDLLRVKCRGNLAAEEQELLERVLYQLRMLYVARAGKTS